MFQDVFVAGKKILLDRQGAITMTEIMLGIALVGLIATTVYSNFKTGFTAAGTTVNGKISSGVNSWQ